MALILPLSFATTAASAGTSAVSTPRTGPELSDVALFLVAAIAVWLTRRALRNRGRKG
jgi:membrane protein implicated in regulation of membrane protease activity